MISISTEILNKDGRSLEKCCHQILRTPRIGLGKELKATHKFSFVKSDDFPDSSGLLLNLLFQSKHEFPVLN